MRHFFHLGRNRVSAVSGFTPTKEEQNKYVYSFCPSAVGAKLRSGFTLIELLVVVAIIGLLASVVLASLTAARAKGADAAIKSGINQARTQAELYYHNNGSSYLNLCADTVVDSIEAGITSSGGVPLCSATATLYRISSQLKTNPLEYYCVDSTGQMYTGLSVPSGDMCP